MRLISIIGLLTQRYTICDAFVPPEPIRDNFSGIPSTVDVIVIGAGWAGMSAANSLARANVSFLVFESSNRTGGRSHAVPFGDSRIWSGVVECGSNWVSGVGGGAAGFIKTAPKSPVENPVHTLAIQEGLRMVRVPGGTDSNMSDYDAVYTSCGDINGDAGSRIRKWADSSFVCLNASASRASPNMSVREGLEACGWHPQSEEEWAVDWAMSGEDQNGEPARKQASLSVLSRCLDFCIYRPPPHLPRR